MKKIKWIIGASLIVVAVAVLLWRNQARNAARMAQRINVVPAVSLIAVHRGQIDENLSLVGTVLANRDVLVVSETVGRVTAVHVDVGAVVQAGTVLVTVDDELKLAAFRTAEVNFEKAGKDLQRYEALYKTNAVTDAELEGARLAYKAAEAQFIAARRQYQDTRITSPIAGVVSSRLVDKGGMVQPGMPIAEVVDISTLKVALNVAEADVFKLRINGAVSVETDIYPGIRFAGAIRTISAKADDGHTYRVETALANSAAHPLKAGMFSRVTFPSISRRDALKIPRECLIGSRREPQVFVVTDNIAHLRSITVGAEVGLEVEVLGGLREGERVVRSGQNNINDGSVVIVAGGTR